MKKNNNVDLSLNTNKEEANMSNEIKTELELLGQFINNLNNKEEMEIMEKEIKATEEEEVVRELNRLQGERESWAEELLENPFSDNNIKKRRESGNKLVMDSKSKAYQEVLESKERERKETKKARPDTSNAPYLNSWERANRHMADRQEQKHILLNRGWL